MTQFSVILLLDPLPLLRRTIYGRHDDIEKLDEQQKPNCKSRSGIIDSSDGTSARIEVVSPFTQMHARTPWILDYRSLFRQPSRRATVQELPGGLPELQSTKEALENWLLSAPSHEVESYSNRLGPASMIFKIVHQDTLDVLRLMRLALAEFELASNDSVLQERALHWRYRMDQFRSHLILIEASVQSFVKYVQDDAAGESHHSPPDIETSPIEYLLFKVLEEIKTHKERITEAYTSLTSKVQISDSHRSIAEAETVTRLTELAFLFIPLSFATSIFGMQIIDASTPASTYVAVAVTLTSAAYLLRFFVHRTTELRSDVIRNLRNKIIAYAKLRPGSHIPTMVFISWVSHLWSQQAQAFWPLNIVTPIILAVVVVSLPIVWTSSIDTALKIAISCLFVSLPMFLLGFYFVRVYHKSRRTSPGGRSWVRSRGEP